MKIALLLALGLALLSTRLAAAPEAAALRFLALGDSYTIGEGVAAADRWPAQLVALLGERGVRVAPPEIIARTGWTSSQLASAITDAAPRGPYDLVTLLVGVNDQYRGLDVDGYRPRFVALLERAIAFAGGRPERVIVVSIPDWSVTPFALSSGRDLGETAVAIARFNRVNREETAKKGARWVDVTPASQRAAGGGTLLARDGLHPSAAQYATWARLVLPEALAALGAKR